MVLEISVEMKKRKSIVSIRKRPWRWRRRRRRRLQMKYVERKVFGTFVKKFTYATAKRRKFIERNFELLNCVLNWWFNNSNLICALKTLHAISFLNPPRHIPLRNENYTQNHTTPLSDSSYPLCYLTKDFWDTPKEKSWIIWILKQKVHWVRESLIYLNFLNCLPGCYFMSQRSHFNNIWVFLSL